MKYTVDVAGALVEVEIAAGQVSVAGRPVSVRLAGRPGEATRQLVRERSARPLVAERGGERGAWQLAADGFRLQVRVLDPRDLAVRAASSRSGVARAGGLIKAPMPGLVLRVLVEAGATVEAGQGLVVIEAMKMENQIKAPGPGVVRKVHVAAGGPVERGAPLVEVGEE